MLLEYVTCVHFFHKVFLPNIIRLPIYLRSISCCESEGFQGSSAGAIYVKEGSFTQSGGTSTITDASAGSDGGVVRMLRNPFILAML